MPTLPPALRNTLRGIRSAPTLSLAIVATLALAIGANTVIFSAVDGILLKALPFGNADRLVVFTSRMSSGGDADVSARDFVDWRRDIHGLDAMAAWEVDDIAITGDGANAAHLEQALVGADFFSLLGVPVEFGRAFSADDDRPGAPRVAVLSDGTWRARFGGDPHVVGRTVRLNGVLTTIVGVAPPTLRYPESPAIWVPLTFDSAQLSERERGAHNYTVIGRLAPGITLPAARAEVIAVTERLRQQHLDADANNRYQIAPLQSVVVASARLPLLVLLGAVGCVLLVACANIATLLLARATRRAPEYGLRVALGASRARVIRELLTESAVLAVAGGGLGVALAIVGVRVLVATQATRLPRIEMVTLDAPVLAFSAALIMLTAILFGVVPAWQSSAPELVETLRTGTRGGGSHRRSIRIRNGLVIGEMGVAVVLLVAAGLLGQTFARLTSVDLGFRPDRVVRFETRLPPSQYRVWAKKRAFVHQVVAGLEALPGTEAAAAGAALPFTSSQPMTSMHVIGRPEEAPGREETVFVERVTPGLFATLGMRVLAGRGFTTDDRAGGHAVAIINEAAARAYFAGDSPLGRTITMGFTVDSTGHDPHDASGEIVGIVANTQRSQLASPADPTVYMPYDQASPNGLVFVARTTADPGTFLAAARRVVTEVDPDMPIFGGGTMLDQVRSSIAEPALEATLVSAFAAIALLLAVIGTYGVISYTARERWREMGIRLALGARQSQVMGLVLGSGVRLAAAGLALGVVGSLVASRVIQSLLFGVKPTDTPTYVVTSIGLVGVALIASWVPARRAAGVDPAVTMRAE